MPKYQIYCSKCKLEYEVEKSYNDKTPLTCPKKHTTVRKIITSPNAIIYNDDGFTKRTKGE